MRWRWIFSVIPDVQSFKKAQKKSTDLRWTSFSIETDGSCNTQFSFGWRLQCEDILGPQVLWQGKRGFLIRPASTPCCIQMLTVEKQSEWSFILPDWALQCQLLFWKVKRYLLHLLGKWAAACFGRDCYYGEVLSLALYFWLYVFMSAWISPAITALWLSD